MKNNVNNDNLKEGKEKRVSIFGIKLLFFIKHFLGYRIFKISVGVVVFFFWIFSKRERMISNEFKNILNSFEKKHNLKISRFNSFWHFLFYSLSLSDRIEAFLGKLIKLSVEDEVKNIKDWKLLQSFIKKKIGCFLIFSHVGNIYVLSSIRQQVKNNVDVDIFMNLDQTPIFHSLMLNKKEKEKEKENENQNQNHTQRNSSINFYSTSNMDIKTGYDILDLLDRSHLILMAADRPNDKSLKHTKKVKILDRNCLISKSILRVSLMSQAPVFFISCLKISDEYKIYIRYFDRKSGKDVCEEYADFIEGLIIKSPLNYSNWFDFFDRS